MCNGIVRVPVEADLRVDGVPVMAALARFVSQEDEDLDYLLACLANAGIDPNTYGKSVDEVPPLLIAARQRNWGICDLFLHPEGPNASPNVDTRVISTSARISHPTSSTDCICCLGGH